MADESGERSFPPYPGGYPHGMPHHPHHPHYPHHHPHFPPHHHRPPFPPYHPPNDSSLSFDDQEPQPENDSSLSFDHQEPQPETSPPLEFLPEPEPQPIHPPHFGYGGYYWVDCDSNRGAYPTSVMGGVDQDGTQIYVGRAFYDGDWIPAKVIPEKNIAYIAYNGDEVPVHQYQVLCEQRFDWVPCSGGAIPPNAVIGGRTSDGEHLYIGRAEHEGSNTVGKVHPSHGSLYIPFGGKEIAYPDYEILVLR